jgi:hypothetical protein
MSSFERAASSFQKQLIIMGLTHILNTSIPKMVTAIVRQSTVYVLELGSEVGLLTWTEQLVCEQSGDYY